MAMTQRIEKGKERKLKGGKGDEEEIARTNPRKRKAARGRLLVSGAWDEPLVGFSDHSVDQRFDVYIQRERGGKLEDCAIQCIER